LGFTCMLLCGLFALHFCAADRGCQAGTRPSLRPLGQEGRRVQGKLGRNAPRGCEGVSV